MIPWGWSSSGEGRLSSSTNKNGLGLFVTSRKYYYSWWNFKELLFSPLKTLGFHDPVIDVRGASCPDLWPSELPVWLLWPKPWLFAVYRGLYYPIIYIYDIYIYRYDYLILSIYIWLYIYIGIISKAIWMIPMNQSVVHGMSAKNFVSVSQVW